MSSNLLKAIDFRTVMGQVCGSYDQDRIQFQAKLINEEYFEFIESLQKGDKSSQLKELTDLVYVCYQLAASVGWDLDEAYDLVHQSNMSKLVDGKPLRNDDGKVLKGPNYRPPCLDHLV